MGQSTRSPKGSNGELRRRSSKKPKKSPSTENPLGRTAAGYHSAEVPAPRLVSHAANDALVTYLSSLPHHAGMLPSTPVVSVNESDSISQALGVLFATHLRALVVTNDAGEGVGFFSLNDVVDWLAMNAGEDPMADPLDATLTKSMEAAELKSATVGAVMNCGNKERMVALPANATSMADILKAVVDNKAERIGIEDPASKQVVGVVTQSRVLALINAARELVPNTYTPVRELNNLISKNVVEVDARSSVASAVKAMHEHGVTAVALVERGIGAAAGGASQLAGVFSSTDLKRLGPGIHNLESLNGSLQEFMATPGRIIAHTVTPECTLEEVIARLVCMRLHRIFVVSADDSRSLVGAISVADVLDYLYGARA